MVAETEIREGEMRAADANPFQAPAMEAVPATGPGAGQIVLRIVEWLSGLPIVLLGLAQCGVAALSFGLSFVTDVPVTALMTVLLFANGLMLVVPGVLLCMGRSWAAWLTLLFGLTAFVLGLVTTNAVFLVFGGSLAGLAIVILILAAVFERRRA